MFMKMQTALNSKNQQDIDKYFNYYSWKNAQYVKTSYLVKNRNDETVLGTESLTMTKDEYIKYLKRIIFKADQYVITFTIDSININPNKHEGIVSITSSDIAINRDADLQTKAPILRTSAATNKCNFSIGLSATDLLIYGMSCQEKIVKEVMNNVEVKTN
jgi:hypothetical protein